MGCGSSRAQTKWASELALHDPDSVCGRRFRKWAGEPDVEGLEGGSGGGVGDGGDVVRVRLCRHSLIKYLMQSRECENRCDESEMVLLPKPS